MADLNQQQVVDYIKGISVLELSQLVKALESELGVSAAAAMPMAMPGGGGAAAGGAAAHYFYRLPILEDQSPMYSLPKNVYRERKDFSKIKTTVPIPNLIEIQRKSYERFLQMNRLPSEREDAGLQSVFKSVFPISD